MATADHLARLAAELACSTPLDRFDAHSAHQFPWRHFRDPYDLCVYELGDTAAHQFVWPYLLRYPGIVVLRATSLGGRAGDLRRSDRGHDYAAERAFAGADLLRIPVQAARLVVVFDGAIAQALSDRFQVRVAVVPVGVQEDQGVQEVQRVHGHPGPVRFGLAGAAHHDMAVRAMRRANDSGAAAELAELRDADVILALHWPPGAEPPATALRGMAAGKPVVVFETEVTAAWPALDPQTWQPRGYDPAREPIAVSIDPRDDEHSLMRTIKRLAADAALRRSLGASGQQWWREHATLAGAVAAWRGVFDEARRLAAPPRPDGWPDHLDADGSAHTRAILDEFGVTVDFL